MMKLCHFALASGCFGAFVTDRSTFGANGCRQCGGLDENAGSYLILDFSHPVPTFDGHLDSHRGKKDRKK